LITVVGWVWSQQSEGGASMLALLVFFGSLCGMFAGMVLAVVGGCMGSAAPRDSKVRGWGIATCVFAVPALALTVVLLLGAFDAVLTEMVRQDREARIGNPLGDDAEAPKERTAAFTPDELRTCAYVLEAVGVLGVGCYLLCLQSIARHFKREGLAVGVICYLMFFLLFVAGLNVLAITRPGEPQEGAASLDRIKMASWVFLACVGILGAWGLVVVGMVRGVMTQGLLRG
jgi:hypothetical protein